MGCLGVDARHGPGGHEVQTFNKGVDHSDRSHSVQHMPYSVTVVFLFLIALFGMEELPG